MKSVLIADLCQPVKSVNWTEFKSDSFDYIDIGAIDRDLKRVTSASKLPVVDAPSRAKQPVIEGDILVSTVRSNLNAVAQINNTYSGSIASSGYCVLRPIKERLESRYLYYYTRTIPFIGYLVNLATGASYPAVSDKIVKSNKIPLPSLETQKRIVVLLDQAQELIDKRKEQITLMDQLVQSLFYDMFGDPVTNPKGWDKFKIPAISTATQIGPFGSLLHQQDYIEGGIPLINPMHIQGGLVVPNCSYSISEKKLSELSRYQVKVNDLIMGRRGEMGRCAVITDKEDGYLCGTGSLFIRPCLDKITSTFLWFVLSSKSMKKKLEEFSLGATMPNLNKKIIDNLTLPTPPLKLQTTFTERVQKIENQKKAMTKSLKKLEDNFNSLMQRAFKGELT